MKKWTLLLVCFLLLSGCTGDPVSTVTAPPGGTTTPSVPPAATATPAVTAVPSATVTSAPSETPAPTETLDPAETPLPTASGAPVEEPWVWNGALETLTLADFPTELLEGAALMERAGGLNLVAGLSEQDAWVYEYQSEGEASLILRIGEQWRHHDIAPVLNPPLRVVQLYAGDYDGDLALELALTVPVTSGTGVGIWDLYVAELDGDGGWALQRFDPEDYVAILDSAVTTAYDAETHILTAQEGEHTLELPLTELALASVNGLVFGTVVDFTMDGDGIRARFGGLLDAEGVPPGAVFPLAVEADVIYTGSVFGLTNLALVPYEIN